MYLLLSVPKSAIAQCNFLREMLTSVLAFISVFTVAVYLRLFGHTGALCWQGSLTEGKEGARGGMGAPGTVLSGVTSV